MGFFSKLFGKNDFDPLTPFMEHPDGTFGSSIEAMTHAIGRLRKIKNCDHWITFSAQGQGNGPDVYEFADIRLLNNLIVTGDKPIDLPLIIIHAKVDGLKIVPSGDHYSIAAASDSEAARIFDALFRLHFGIKPFEDENDNYAIGAEWD